jgi:hypothetical protein
MRETTRGKARWLLVANAVNVRLVTADRIVAFVRGEHGTYGVELSPDGWHCGCPSFRPCSHIEAVKLVTVLRKAVEAGRER